CTTMPQPGEQSRQRTREQRRITLSQAEQTQAPKTTQGHVLVLGSQGVLGSMVVSAFERAGWMTIRAGRRLPFEPGFREVDLARPETLEKALGELATYTAATGNRGLVVSTVPDPRMIAERTVLRHGGLILNVSTVAPTHIKHLRLAPLPVPAQAAGGGETDGEESEGIAGQNRVRGTVVAYAGIAPGLTNLVAANLLAEYPDADEIELAFTVSARSVAGPAGADFLHAGLTSAARHRTVVIPLPAPFGRTRCLGFGERDFGWLGPVAEGKIVASYVCLTPRAVRYALMAANAAGIVSRVPRVAPATSTPTAEPIAHWVAVRKDGMRLAARTIRGHGDYRSAAAVTVLFAQALIESTSPPGVLLPEEAVSLDQIRPGLADMGIFINDEHVSLGSPARD
ncbi:MAG: hypothetical protein ACRDN0_32405, partial [Trebonia sp.]